MSISELQFSTTCRCRACRFLQERATNIIRRVQYYGIEKLYPTEIPNHLAAIRNHHCQANLSNSHVEHNTMSVGPKYDPYHRDIWTMYRNGHVITVIMCGLAGETLTVDGVDLIQNAYDPKEVKEVYEGVKVFTGFEMDEWMDAYYRAHRNDVEDPMGPMSWYE